LKNTVLINGRFLTRPATGVDRFAIELLRAWIPGFGVSREAKAVAPHGQELVAAGLDMSVARMGRLTGHAWEQLELPTISKDALLVNLCSTGPALLQRQLIVLHDANVMVNPWVFSFAFRNWYRCLFACVMRRAAIVATVSKFSASELMKHVGGRARGLEIIYESGEHVLRHRADFNILQKLGIVEQRFVLAVGSRTPNKNFEGVVKAAAELADLDVKVVLAGGSNSRVFAGASLDQKNLILAGYVTDGELRALYERADCFLYPSFYEGFGLPPLEAMHCGCPVVVSRRASLPEVCGEAARYCDPDDFRDIARQVRTVLSSKELRKELTEAGLQRAAGYTWAASAKQFEEILAREIS
jgi:glycosyltransferase involved in cell wall biosynthesis